MKATYHQEEELFKWSKAYLFLYLSHAVVIGYSSFRIPYRVRLTHTTPHSHHSHSTPYHTHITAIPTPQPYYTYNRSLNKNTIGEGV